MMCYSKQEKNSSVGRKKKKKAQFLGFLGFILFSAKLHICLPFLFTLCFFAKIEFVVRTVKFTLMHEIQEN